MRAKKLLRFYLLPALIALFAATSCYAKNPIRTIDGTVTRVSDGDTIQVTDSHGTKVKIRFYGIDAPETQKPDKPGQPMGDEAFLALKSKVNRQSVRLEVMDIDQYKRAVAIVWFGGRNINREMVADGWAWAYRQYLDRPHASEYIEAEAEARRARKGLWQQSNPQPPWDFRKELKSHRSKNDCNRGIPLWGHRDGSCGGNSFAGILR